MATQQAADDRLSIAYWRPDPALARYVSGYHLYTLRLAPGERLDDIFFPGWANIRFAFDADDWRVRIAGRSFDPVPSDSLFGATSSAIYSNSGSGTLAGAGLTPIGWARLIGADASQFADRVSPLGPAIGAGEAAALRAAVESMGPRDAFDAWFLDRLGRSDAEDERVAALFALINDPAIGSAGELSERTGVSPRALTRLSRSAFGFTPKLLLRRARFLRALMQVQEVDRGGWAAAAAAAGYYDQSHFLRDCNDFLGLSLGAFLRRPKPMAEASLRLRAQILGAPVQSLHVVENA